MKHANIIVPGNSDNTVAVNLIVDNLRVQVLKIEQIKEVKKLPFNYLTMLNPLWLQDGSEDEHPLIQSKKIIMPTDETVKNETISIFKLFSKKFSKTLYR